MSSSIDDGNPNYNPLADVVSNFSSSKKESTADFLAKEFEDGMKTNAHFTEDDLVTKYCNLEDETSIEAKKKNKIDPTSAKFFDEFMKDPNIENARLRKLQEEAKKELGENKFFQLMCSDQHNELKKFRSFDFRLDEEELVKFKENGFVVSERMAVESFAEAYYQIYSDDLPVFVTADSILHAWHMSFSTILQSVESSSLLPTIQKILFAMHEAIPQEAANIAHMKEIDFYLSVAISLLYDTKHKCMPENNEKVDETLQKIGNLETSSMEMFGESREVDFSQFKPRGHYASSEDLSKYFRAMMWLGRTDFRLCLGTETSRTQLRSSLALIGLLGKSGQASLFKQFSCMLEKLMGETDSLDALSFFPLVVEVVNNLFAPTESELDKVEGILNQLNVGVEQVQSQIRMEGDKKPKSFAFFGQKFTMDAFVFNRVTFDNIVWNGENVQRRRPNGLDIAFSVLGNDIAAKDVVQSIKATNSASKWRDGKKYAHNLHALRCAIDKLPESAWSTSIYSQWLYALRALSRVPNERASALFQSDAWRKRVVSAQLGSWSELKHDTVLYAKQAYGCMTMCEYPKGLVEPIPEFFVRMANMAKSMEKLLDEADIYAAPSSGNPGWFGSPKEDYTSFLSDFSSIMHQLCEICIAQRDKNKLTDKQEDFLGSVMNETHGSGGTRYNGWYPKLFFAGRESSGEFKPRIADVFTAPEDVQTGDPGGILHVGVGKVFQSIVAVDGVAYSGPVFSYYEFEKGVDERLDDSEWEKMLLQGQDMPSLPEWSTESFIVSK